MRALVRVWVCMCARMCPHSRVRARVCVCVCMCACDELGLTFACEPHVPVLQQVCY